MKRDAVKAFFLSCHEAKHITTLFPTLPEGMVVRDVRIIDTIDRLQKQAGRVRISDVSSSMGVTRPSVTNAITRLESLGYVEKSHDEADGRAVHVSLTQAGRDFEKVYVDRFYDWACDQLADVSERDFVIARRVIQAVHEVMAPGGFDPGDYSPSLGGRNGEAAGDEACGKNE